MSLAREIAKHYGQGKEVKNRDGWLTCCPIHGDTNPSMAVTDIGSSDVMVYCHTSGCDFKEIKDQMRADGVLPEWKPDPSKSKKIHTASATRNPVPEEKVSSVWRMAGDEGLEHASRYLASRAITIDPLPRCIRWNEYRDKKTGDMVCAIVAAASKPGDDAIYAVQRLFMKMEDGNVSKTDEKLLGNCGGRGTWFKSKGDVTEIVAGEGIETVLSAMQATGKNGVAALSTSGMKNLIFPEETETLYILSDSDPVREKPSASMPGQKAAYIMAKKFEASREGRKAFIVSPDDTCFSDKPKKQDFNDLLKVDPTGESIKKRFDKAIKFPEMEWTPPQGSAEEEEEDDEEDDFYPPATIAALRKMNKEYAAVILGSDFRVAMEGFDDDAKMNTVSFLKQSSFYAYHADEKVGVPTGANKDIKYKELAKIWMGWPGKRKFKGVVFDPSEKSTRAYNLFQGFPLTPKKGDWSLMKEHIFKVICDGNSEHFEYVMAWMARVVQDPGGDKPGVALVLKGGKGIGKGVFANYYGSIFGEAFIPIADAASFTGRFNMHLSKSLMVFLDEAVWGGDKKAEGKLKQLITEPTIVFEPKGIDSIAMRNFINVIIASNEDWIIPATGDERRFCVLQPSAAYQKNTIHFAKIIKEQRNGGAEAMMYDLLEFDCSVVDLRQAPMTEGLADQVQASLPSVMEFWYTLIDREHVLTDKETGIPVKTDLVEDGAPLNELWPGAVFKYELYNEYVQWCRIQNERFPKNQTHFWRETFCFWPGGKPGRMQRRNAANKVLDALIIPLKDEAREAFSKATKINFDVQTDENAKLEELTPFSGQF